MKRLKGTDRYGTNIAILKEVGIYGNEILVATGNAPWDSLSASALNRPILLVNKELNDAHKAILEKLPETAKIYILGGEAAVNEVIAKDLEEYGSVKRLKGTGRYETSVAIAKEFFGEGAGAVTLAYGENFADGLCGGPVAEFIKAPVILVNEGSTAAASKYAENATMGYVFGGSGVVSDATVVEITGVMARTYATEYVFNLAEGEEVYLDNLIFTEDVTVNGNNAIIAFNNCRFDGNVINTADVATRVLIFESDVNGKLVFDNHTKEATIETNLPKFLTDASVEAICEECAGSVVTIGDIGIVVNGNAYYLETCEYYLDSATGEIVPYEGQEADYLIVAQWWENGEKVVMSICEKE